MQNLKAIRNFNYGGKYVKKEGDTFEANEADAKELLSYKFVEKVDKSHKKIQKK